MFDLQALALQADLTRVWTFMMAREATSMTFPHLDISMGHHEISHHNFEADKLDALAKINVNQSELFAYFLTRLDALKEGNSTLLDHSLIMYGSDLSVPTVHSQHDLPIIVAGGAAGRIAGGRYIRLSRGHNPADESVSHDARQSGRADGEIRRQHRQTEPPRGVDRECARAILFTLCPAVWVRRAGPCAGHRRYANPAQALIDAVQSDDRAAVAALLRPEGAT